jgi:glutamate synthase domain-containing protein 2
LHPQISEQIKKRKKSVSLKLNDQAKRTNKNAKSELAMSPEKYLQRLREVAKSGTIKPEVKKSALELLAKIENPNQLANLGMQCLRKASTHGEGSVTAAIWADRKFSDKQYEQLLKHPALGAGQGGVA